MNTPETGTSSIQADFPSTGSGSPSKNTPETGTSSNVLESQIAIRMNDAKNANLGEVMVNHNDDNKLINSIYLAEKM